MIKYIFLCFCLFFSSHLYAQNNLQPKNILIIGDSIGAGFGVAQDKSWSHLLQQRLTQKHYPYKVINASISGDTTSGGRKRLEKSLQVHQPDIVIIELGGNDGLRGLNLNQMQSNLANMIEQCQQKNIKVLLVGMQLPPNYGLSFTRRFSSIYQTLATDKKIPLVPFLLAGFANKPAFFQADQIHPNASAQIYILDNIWQKLEPLLNNRS